jgi:tRNA pseudouridine38-40 synthase
MAYAGHDFEGWQTQPHGRTVQDALEGALMQIAGIGIPTVCAGRTDSGVHALGQVVHFDAPVQRPLQAWVRGVNTHLPATCSVQWACAVPDHFNARFSARFRRYHYWIYRSPVRHPLIGTAAWVFQPLDVDAMRQAALALLGEHDFSAFRAAQCQANTPVRQLMQCSIDASGPMIRITLQANAFLHHMARNIVGALLEVGMGNRSAPWLGGLLASRDRRLAAKTAPACGLSLVEVGYDDVFALPACVVPQWPASMLP